MEKEIGIITYHNAINYGAALQSYALQKYIKELGKNVEVINYLCPAVEAQYSFKSLKCSGSFLHFSAHNLTCFLRLGKKRRFKEFVKNNVSISSIVDQKSIGKTGYKVLISGSDQVFNPICNSSDSAYFLSFAESGKKYSYAASLGSIQQFEGSKIDTLSLLNDFECVSLREKSSVDYLEGKLKTKVILSVDPVWLLKKEQWDSILNRPKKRKRPFILVYNLMDFKKMCLYVKKLSKKRRVPVVAINRTLRGDLMYFASSKIKSNCSPTVFLELIRDCEYFFTDSFHGVSFAQIFETKFGVFLNEKKENTNSRILDLLELSGLTDRIVDDTSFNLDAPIDFLMAKNRLENLISKSKGYIGEITQ